MDTLTCLLAEAGGMLQAVAESEGQVITQRQAELAADMSYRMLDAVGLDCLGKPRTQGDPPCSQD